MALIIIGVIAMVTELYGILYLGITFIVTIISINLFTRKSIGAKTGAVILNTDLIYKILMPNKYKKAIRELEDSEIIEKHNKSVK